MALYVTGDTHGEEGRFMYLDSEMMRNLNAEDYLIVCGDFGYLFNGSYRERKFVKFLAEDIPFKILFVDGNHENFDIINKHPIEEWCGGKVHIIGRDKDEPKVVHLMRGQVFEIEGKKIFTFGGGCSIDASMRTKGYSWWHEEMPNNDEMKEAIRNLEKHNHKVDYIITHAAPEKTMCLLNKENVNEKPLNNFLEMVRRTTHYQHWYFGHLHMDKDLQYNQTCLWFQVRNMETNEIIE